MSNIVRDAAELFYGEKEEIFRAGLAATTYQHIDDTFARVGGELWHTHIVCNPFHSTYFTTPHKDRLTILGLLWSRPWTYRFNDLTQRLLEEFRVPRKWRQLAATAPQDQDLNEAELEDMLEKWSPSRRLACLDRLREAAALASYRAAGPCTDFGGRRRETRQVRVGRVWVVLDSRGPALQGVVSGGAAA